MAWTLVRVDEAPMTLADLQMMAIEDSMKRHKGKKELVADELGVSLKTIYNKMTEKYGPKTKMYREPKNSLKGSSSNNDR